MARPQHPAEGRGLPLEEIDVGAAPLCGLRRGQLEAGPTEDTVAPQGDHERVGIDVLGSGLTHDSGSARSAASLGTSGAAFSSQRTRLSSSTAEQFGPPEPEKCQLVTVRADEQIDARRHAPSDRLERVAREEDTVDDRKERAAGSGRDRVGASRSPPSPPEVPRRGSVPTPLGCTPRRRAPRQAVRPTRSASSTECTCTPPLCTMAR